jgi:hypothetical protein
MGRPTKQMQISNPKRSMLKKESLMDTISLQNTKTLEHVFTNELQQRKAMRTQRMNTLWMVLAIATILLSLYVLTPLFTLIQ